MLRHEFRTKPHGLADLLLPFALVADGILLQTDGSLIAGWKFAGPDMGSASAAELEALSARFNEALRLGSSWMVQCDLIRSPAPAYPEPGAFPEPITRLIDEERRMQFQAEGRHFESEYFLTLTHLPPLEREERARGWLFSGGDPRSQAASRTLERFKNTVERFENVFANLFQTTRLRRVPGPADGVACDDLLRYVSRCITGYDHPCALPDVPAYLNSTLCSSDFVAGIQPEVAGRRIAVVAIDGFPRASYPGILSALSSLPIRYRWNTRAILLDPLEAKRVLDKLRKKWKSKIRGFKDQVQNTQKGAFSLHASDLAADAESAMSLAEAGDVQFALYSSSVILLDDDEERVAGSVQRVMKTIQNLGFGCRLETVNAVEAWRGSIPGDGYSNVRRVLLHSLNLADMFPTTSVWAGLKENPSSLMPVQTPPLLLAATTGATPFRLNLHVSDLGHTLIAGPSRSGKSTMVAIISAQWFRYAGARLFAFDRGYSLWALTVAVGGDFYDVASQDGVLSFCPLSEIDSDGDLAWAAGWIEALCELNGLRVIPRLKNSITDALRLLRQSPTRSLTEFCANCQDLEIRQALQHFTIQGPLGHLLDAESDVLGSDLSRFVCFEMENLSKLDDKAVVPVMLYLFHRIERQLDGSPTLVMIDEAWAALGHPLFASRLETWLRTMAKNNAVVVLATQQLSDIAESSIADVVIENCPTKILLPNAEAQTRGSSDHPGPRDFYESLGLNDREIEIVQTAQPLQHYYTICPLGRRLIDLGLGQVALAFVGVNGREERASLRRLIEHHPDNWREVWLRLRKLPKWADYLHGLANPIDQVVDTPYAFQGDRV